MDKLKYIRLNNNADLRGDSYYIPREAIDFIGVVDEIHFATIAPLAVRGNHYHINRNEFIIINFSDCCELACKDLESKNIYQKTFEGCGAILIEVMSNVVHAIKNNGREPIYLISCSNKRFDPSNPDTFKEVIIE